METWFKKSLKKAVCFVVHSLIPTFLFCSVFRSELDNLPNNHSCDVIGLVTFVGRIERARKRGFCINKTLRIYQTFFNFPKKHLHVFLNICLHRTQWRLLALSLGTCHWWDLRATIYTGNIRNFSARCVWAYSSKYLSLYSIY